jgi:hypothetical protein
MGKMYLMSSSATAIMEKDILSKEGASVFILKKVICAPSDKMKRGRQVTIIRLWQRFL